MTRRDYLLAELRRASLRAGLWQADIDAVGMAQGRARRARAGARIAPRVRLSATHFTKGNFMKRKRKINGPFVPLPLAILDAPAWRAMDFTARALWIELRRKL